MRRRTVVVHDRLAIREFRLRAARDRDHGLQILTFEQLAARLAGGFSRPIDTESLMSAVRTGLESTALGELDEIKMLPGMLRASAETLRKAWLAGIDLSARANDHPRIASMAALEAAVIKSLPPDMMRPADLVRQAKDRISHAPEIFGSVEVVGTTELSPVWRPLLQELVKRLPTTWNAGPRTIPIWLEASGIEIRRTPACAPEVVATSSATPLHEAIEAFRWARELLASGQAAPQEIAIASNSPAEYDDYMLALRAETALEVHFVHGMSALATRDGQAASSLADLLVRGLTQNRVRRLANLANGPRNPFKLLPDGWTRILPAEAPLSSLVAWERLLMAIAPQQWPDGVDHSRELMPAIQLLARGTGAALEAGEQFFTGRTLAIWRTALTNSNPAAVDAALSSLRIDDSLEAVASIAWMPAAALAASPRRFIRLLGLTSAHWPRAASEDRLLSDHIIPTVELDPLPVAAADRRDFETILRSTATQVILSRARRDAGGRVLGRSPLLHDRGDEIFLGRTRFPAHAMSETDRLLARPMEFSGLPQAKSAGACWKNWQASVITSHDGLMRADHPLIRAVLGRLQSASSLRKLLRDPLGFVWKYALGLNAPEIEEEPLVLDALKFGTLVHSLLEHAVIDIEARGGLAAASKDVIRTALETASANVRADWEQGRSIPPRIIWERTLHEARSLAFAALTHQDPPLKDQRSFAEVPFGGQKPRGGGGALPWDPVAAVQIPGTSLRVGGLIDRLDLSGDRAAARVRDYKTGKSPKFAIVLDGGKELQRCLYAFAVKALIDKKVEVQASLLYPRDGKILILNQPDAVLDSLANALAYASASLVAGHAPPGPDTADTYNELALALPANATKTYCKIKEAAVAELLGSAGQIWEVS